MRIGSHEGLGHYSFHNSYRRSLMRVVKPLVIAGAIVLAPAIPRQSTTSHSSPFLAPRAAFAQDLESTAEIEVDPVMKTIAGNRCNSRSNAFLTSVCDSSDGKTALAKAYQVAFNNLSGSLKSNIKIAGDGRILVEAGSSLSYDIQDLLNNTQKSPSDFGLEFIKKDQEEIVIADEASLAKVFSSVFVLQLGDIDLKVFRDMSLSAPTEENTQPGESPTTIEEQPEIIPFVQAAIDAWKAAVKNQTQKN